jgi:hypothetical protein
MGNGVQDGDDNMASSSGFGEAGDSDGEWVGSGGGSELDEAMQSECLGPPTATRRELPTTRQESAVYAPLACIPRGKEAQEEWKRGRGSGRRRLRGPPLHGAAGGRCLEPPSHGESSQLPARNPRYTSPARYRAPLWRASPGGRLL